MTKLTDFQKKRYGKALLTLLFTLISVAYVFPVLMVVVNSFKLNTFVKTDTFAMPNAESFAGWDNFIKEANTGKGLKVQPWMKPVFTYVVPCAIIVIYITGLLNFAWK